MDKTGVMLSMLSSVKVLVGKGDRRNYRGARVKRTTITAIECISADGRYLNPMIIWPATTHRSNWTTFPTPGWQYACNESGYTDSNISLQPRVLILDGFGTHETLEILEYCFANNIILCRLPSHTSHKLQPCDVAVFAPLKTAYREQVERLERGGVNTLGKEHFTSLYSPARERAFTPKNIKAGFAASGLFPFNPERVLRTMPKPAAGLTVSITNEASCRQDSVPQGDAVLPSTPVTPVSAEGLMSLQNLILERDAHALDERSKQSLQRHLLKFAKATQLSFTKGALQQNHIHLLMSINNEAKPRRSTKSDILAKGTGKVMSYEDLQEARTKRAEKEATKEAIKEKPEATTAEANAGPSVPKGKEKRGRKRKSTALEADAGSSVLKGKVVRMSEVKAAIDTEVSWRAPIAKMI
ncbi:DDE-domain-containing protein [Amniculicola lignicola CBS 123094]|uniref:DDE-domain-containing protein n=1 Tax=Amniculicola lignicola CBS 123094 TaxID=1392246 RepID=A0A6A5WZ54_9PLEO|nr:DDE-domain-containing protein [Amniculicola lignicola CBS 123094]